MRFSYGLTLTSKEFLSNVDKFKVIFLDFKNIDTIGQGFADEIFRVHKIKHPEITIIPLNTTSDVEYMIKKSNENENIKIKQKTKVSFFR